MSCKNAQPITRAVPKMSKIPTRLSVSARKSKIPVRLQSSKVNAAAKIPTAENKPKMKETVLKPMITKKTGAPFKDSNMTKAGPKAIIKRKSIEKRKKPKPNMRQTIISEKFIARSKAEGKTTNEKKKTLNPTTDNERRWDLKSMITNDAKTFEQIQAELYTEFEPSEFYKNQILSNKELSPRQIASCYTPPKDKKDPAEMALEKIQRWSSRAKFSLAKENLFPSKLDSQLHEKGNGSTHMNELLPRRCSWAAGSPAKPKYDPYEQAMARIKRMTPGKGQSPIDKLKTGSEFVSRSPFKHKLDPYEEAMARIKRMSLAKPISPIVKLKTGSEILSRTPNKPFSACATQQCPSSDKTMKTKVDNKSTESKGKNCLQKNLLKMSPKDVFKTRAASVYRPLLNLANSPSKQLLKQRLTDISEHSENDSTNHLSQLSTGISSKFSRSSICENSTSDMTPQLTNERMSNRFSSSSLKLPCLSAFSEECSQIVQSTPINPEMSRSIAQLTNGLHNPIPVSVYSSKLFPSPIDFFEENSTHCNPSDCAPIHTPLVLKTIAKFSKAKAEENSDNAIAQKLNFKLDSDTKETTLKTAEVKWEPRYSDYTKHIPTKTKLEEALADEECASIMQKQENGQCFSQCRRSILNPVALILSKGDRMHFVPIQNEIAAV